MKSRMGLHDLRTACLSGIVSLLAPALPSIGAMPPQSCEQLKDLRIPSVSIGSAESIGAGSFKTKDGKALSDLKAFCRVSGVAKPTPDSQIAFEVWMPASAWNGRLWGIGNGDFAGSISQAGLASRLAEGYATVGTDTGHQTAIQYETAWGAGHPEKVVDFAHRGIHEAVVSAKRIVARYYGHPAMRSYFASCSNGGRQALMEAQRYPDDYDGIIAGAAAADWTHIYIGAGLLYFRWLAEGPGYVPASKVPAIHDAVLSKCGGLDRVRDGVIEDPRRCKADVSGLLCRGPESDSCLTQAEMTTVHHLYAGAALAGGKHLFPGFSPGAEDGWGEAHFGTGPGSTDSYRDVIGFFRNIVFEDPSWNEKAYDADRDGKFTEQKLSSIIDATDPDLSRFSAHGGKLIMYHGWSDPIIPAMMSVEYYERAVKHLGAKAAGHGIRLFMVPGMGHCGGGPGPNSFGQFAAGSGDPANKVGAALQRWVEQGIAPERIVATKHEGDDPKREVVRTRPLCPFPLVARYRGSGSTDNESSFECAATPELTRQGIAGNSKRSE
jgi:Tannase and feruloyl esterase